MSNKDKTTSGRVILCKNGVNKRLCSLHLVSKKDLYIDFKRSLPVIRQGLFNRSTGEIDLQKIEIEKIQHLHYVIPEQKMIVTFREKDRPDGHTQGMFFNPKIRNGRYIQWFARVNPQFEKLLNHDKSLSDLEFQINIPIDAVDDTYEIDFWLGFNFDLNQQAQMHAKLVSEYSKNEAAIYDSVLGSKDEFSIYVVLFLPKDHKAVHFTRLLIPNIHPKNLVSI